MYSKQFFVVIIFLFSTLTFSNNVLAVNCINTCAGVTPFLSEKCNDISISNQSVTGSKVIFDVEAYSLPPGINKICLTVDAIAYAGVTKDSPEYCKVVTIVDGIREDEEITFNSSGNHDIDFWSSPELNNPQEYRCGRITVNIADAPTATPTPTPRSDCFDISGAGCYPKNGVPSSCGAIVSTSNGVSRDCIPLCKGYSCERESSTSPYKVTKDDFNHPFNLDSFQDSLNESTAGALGGYCAVGGVIFNGNPPGDFSGETDGPSVLKKLMAGLVEKFNAIAGKSMTPVKMIKDAMQPTKFCPISGFSYFYEGGSVTPLDTQTIIDTQKIFIKNNTELDLLDKINQKDADVNSIVSSNTSQERIVLAVDLLMSTKNMDIDQKGEVLEKIRTTLGTISCQCQDPSQFQANAQNSESNVEGASIQRGEVLGTGPNGHLPGQCAIGAKLFAEDRIACTAKEYCGALKSINEDEYVKCYNCLYEDKGTWTAIGCVYSDFSKTIKEVIFPVAIGFAGLISLGCIIFASITMQTSAGDPEKVKKAQELITSCIAGLIVIIFSVFILRVIGVDILRIPEFGG